MLYSCIWNLLELLRRIIKPVHNVLESREVHWLVDNLVHAHSEALVNVGLVRVGGDRRDLKRDDWDQWLAHCLSLRVFFLDTCLILLLETDDVLSGGAPIHNWHVNVHQDQSEANTAVTSELAVSVCDKLLDSLGSVEGLHHFDPKLILEKHGKWH